MRILKIGFAAAAILALQLSAAAQQTGITVDGAVDRIVTQEHAQVQMLRQYSPLVETYIQSLRPDDALGKVPATDKYFLGRANLEEGVELLPLTEDKEGSIARNVLSMGGLLSVSMEFMPRGFLQMVYADRDELDRQHYKFEYARQEFLGEVRCMVFDVTPLPNTGKGRFVGRIWVEDEDYHIVRFNGTYNGASRKNRFFHFDSWRVNSGKNQWLPAAIYSEESDLKYAMFRKLNFKSQTRLWGYDAGRSRTEQELGKILVESQIPVQDQARAARDLSPLQAQRAWDRQAEQNVVERMEKMRLIAPSGEVDKVLETVVNNLEVTNDLNLDPEIRCRVLMTSTLESFTMGHTIVLSRGLIDVLPDEASLAAVLAHELSHAVLGHPMDTQFAFFDRLVFDDKETFQHFGFARPENEEAEANAKAAELLAKSPYKDQLHTAQLFLQELTARSKEVPNLISAHLGNTVPLDMTVSSANSQAPAATGDSKPTVLAALPLGGRIKVDPWDGSLAMLQSKPVGLVSEREKMPFEVTPVMLYLARQAETATAPQAASATQTTIQ